MNTCKRCDKEFEPTKGLVNYCSLKCRSGREWSEADKKKKSESASQSQKVKEANKKKTGKHFKEIVVNTCSVCGLEIESLITRNQKYHYDCSLKVNGGYREGSGRGKHGKYKGYNCQSSYELAWVIYQLEHDVEFVRNNQGFEYSYEGKVFKYYPDFKLSDGTFVELKGFADKKCEEKIKQFKHTLVVLFKDDMKPILDYVIGKYGKNFISLYE